MSSGIEQSLAVARIPATVDILLNNRPFKELLKEESSGADIVFLGLKRTEESEEDEQVTKMEEVSEVGKVVVFVQNNSLRESFPVLLRSDNQ